MDIYRELILDHYKHPRNFGQLESFDAEASENNVTCGDRVVMQIKIKTQSVNLAESNPIIENIKFSGEGCAINQASASMLTEKVMGMNIDDVLHLTSQDIFDMLGTELTPARVKCAVLPLEVLQKAVTMKK